MWFEEEKKTHTHTALPIKWTQLCMDVLTVQKLDEVQRTWTHVTSQAVGSIFLFFFLCVYWQFALNYSVSR